MAISRVIEVSFGRSSVALVRIDTAYFYNNGILFKPTDIDLPASYQVHWADSPQASTTLETIGTAEGAPIPDDLWNRSRVIYGWIYLHPTNDSGVTAYEVRIYKNVRAGLPDGTEPTPAEQSTIDQLISALNSAVEQTGQDAESTSQSAQSAESAKTAAESARDTAGEYANDAESSAASASTSASQASTSATASAESAEQAAQIKMDVEALADDAQGYAESASQSASASAQSASASANSATTAQGYANSASASAQSASGYASSAQTSAQTASTKATEASTSAQTASQKATEASQSATTASNKATEASGYATASQTAQGLAESARDSAVQAKTDAESAKADAESARDEAQQAVASISGALAEKAPVITDTASGAVASFTDGADDLPLKSLVVDINPVQDTSSGDPSPENICPISGWAECNVYDDPMYGGVINWNQLVPINASSISRTVNGLTLTDHLDGTYTVTGTAEASSGIALLNRTTPAPIGHVFYVSGMVQGSKTTPKKFLGFAGIPIDYGEGGIWKNATAYPVLNLRCDIQQGATITNANITPIVYDLTEMFGEAKANEIYAMDSEAGAAYVKSLFPNDYYPYNAGEKTTVSAVNNNPYTHINIDLGQTVYGGHLDVLSGVLTVDRAMVDLGTLSWINSQYSTETMKAWYVNDFQPAKGASPYAVANVIAEKYKALSTNSVIRTPNSIGIQPSGIKTMIWCSTDVNATPSGSMVYELAEPIEIQLTPNQLNSLYGVNNLWADSGDTEVVYRADTKLFIERLTAPDSVDMIADSNITSGQYFMVGNSLYKATANIANGSAIIVGTNAVRKTLSEALNEINA